jgi:hypothetical protein
MFHHTFDPSPMLVGSHKLILIVTNKQSLPYDFHSSVYDMPPKSHNGMSRTIPAPRITTCSKDDSMLEVYDVPPPGHPPRHSPSTPRSSSSESLVPSTVTLARPCLYLNCSCLRLIFYCLVEYFGRVLVAGEILEEGVLREVRHPFLAD